MKISFFKDEFEFLSNFYLAPFTWKNKTWSTVEHAFQASKSRNPYYVEIIRKAKFPAIAKKIGRKVVLREGWEEIKIPLMTELVLLKFEQNLDLKNKLLSTGSAELVEGNYWHDNFWGNCFCSKCKNVKGQNVLGTILMEVREYLKKL